MSKGKTNKKENSYSQGSYLLITEGTVTMTLTVVPKNESDFNTF